MTHIAITGAGGFLGRRVTAAARAAGLDVRAIRRQESPGDGASPYDADALAGAGAVVHLGARVHVVNDLARDPLAVFRRANRDATLALGEQAIAARVPRFVFISSIHVNGVSTTGRPPFTTADASAPITPYAVSKCEAEDGLRDLAARHEIDLVVLRPVLVCGEGARGNLARLATLVKRGLPLPVNKVSNRRSLIHVDDLSDLILTTAVNGSRSALLLAADPTPVSTATMTREIAAGMDRRARLFHIPPRLLIAASRVTGLSHPVDQLYGSLEVDAAPTLEATGWSPRRGVASGLRELGHSFAG